MVDIVNYCSKLPTDIPQTLSLSRPLQRVSIHSAIVKRDIKCQLGEAFCDLEEIGAMQRRTMPDAPFWRSAYDRSPLVCHRRGQNGRSFAPVRLVENAAWSARNLASKFENDRRACAKLTRTDCSSVGGRWHHDIQRCLFGICWCAPSGAV